MSPPIFTPDGSEVSEVYLPDGSEASEVVAPDGSVVFDGPDFPDSLISYWTFDDADTSGSTAIDTVGSNDATINGATTGVTGANQTYETNEAYSFDGTDDFVIIPARPDRTASSVAVWAKSNNTSSEDRLLGLGNTQPNIVLRLNKGGTADNLNIAIIGESNTASVIVSHPSTTTNWSHYTVTGAENGTMTAYVNGSQVGTDSMGAFGDSDAQDRIGSDRGGFDNFFDGLIDEVREYDKVLSDTEVSNLFNTGSING
jgi:hypothetical protein